VDNLSPLGDEIIRNLHEKILLSESCPRNDFFETRSMMMASPLIHNVAPKPRNSASTRPAAILIVSVNPGTDLANGPREFLGRDF